MNAVTAVGLGVGIHESIPAERYHADPAPEPSLSSSVAHLLVHRSPLHAWAEHPRLNIMREPYCSTPAQEEGTLLHALLLGTPQEIVGVDCDDWRTKAAQEARASARDRGAIPVLGWRLAELERCVRAFREQLSEHEECRDAFADGTPESTLIWREGATWCRARPDWRRSNPRPPLYDVKTTAGSADPDTWERQLRERYALQAAWYLRGARALGLRPAGFVFLVIETDAPHGLCAFAPGPDLLDIAEREIAEALDLWETCLKSGAWPGYSRRIHHVEAPAWQLAKAEHREAMRPARMDAIKPTPEQVAKWNGFIQKLGSTL